MSALPRASESVHRGPGLGCGNKSWSRLSPPLRPPPVLSSSFSEQTIQYGAQSPAGMMTGFLGDESHPWPPAAQPQMWGTLKPPPWWLVPTRSSCPERPLLASPRPEQVGDLPRVTQQACRAGPGALQMSTLFVHILHPRGVPWWGGQRRCRARPLPSDEDPQRLQESLLCLRSVPVASPHPACPACTSPPQPLLHLGRRPALGAPGLPTSSPPDGILMAAF